MQGTWRETLGSARTDTHRAGNGFVIRAAALSDIDNHVCVALYAARTSQLDARFLPMLVCQCNVITDREIKQIVIGLLREDPWQIIVPAVVYKELEKRCKCAGCVPNVVDIIITVTEEYHLQMAEKPADAPVVHARLSAMRRKRQGGRNERRSTGHRAA